MNKQIAPNPCTNCHKSWNFGKVCDKVDTCTDIISYTEYRQQIDEEEAGGLSRDEAIEKVNAEFLKERVDI